MINQSPGLHSFPIGSGEQGNRAKVWPLGPQLMIIFTVDESIIIYSNHLMDHLVYKMSNIMRNAQWESKDMSSNCFLSLSSSQKLPNCSFHNDVNTEK